MSHPLLTFLRPNQLAHGINPNAARAYQRGIEQRSHRSLAEAEESFRQALTFDSEFVEALNELGILFAELGKYAEALAAFARIQTLITPDHPIPQNNIGIVRLHLGDTAQAERCFKKAHRQLPASAIRGNIEIARRGLIAQDEEANLPRLLNSLKDAVDEIIVMDSGSTDRTIEIAQSYGAKVFPFQWSDDFAAARNESQRHASGDWILVTDADSELEAGHAEKIRQAVASGKSRAYAYQRHSPHQNGENIIALPYLFENVEGVKFEGAIHESVDGSLLALGMIPRHTDIVMQHYGYGDPSSMEKRLQRNLKLLEKESLSSQPRPTLHYYLGNTLLQLHRYPEAIEHLKITTGTPTLHWRLRANALQWLIAAYAASEEWTQAEGCAAEAVTLYPAERSAWATQGEIALRRHQPHLACESFKRALQLRETRGAEMSVTMIHDL
ncbi:MAG: glycosyltransferase [Chloroflexi bacterium]|nr:glycosyltransferase [Chloroflexota bacterium]